jgi:hypothetical protein
MLFSYGQPLYSITMDLQAFSILHRKYIVSSVAGKEMGVTLELMALSDIPCMYIKIRLAMSHERINYNSPLELSTHESVPLISVAE